MADGKDSSKDKPRGSKDADAPRGKHDLEASDIPGGPDAPEGFDESIEDEKDAANQLADEDVEGFPSCDVPETGTPLGKVTAMAGNGRYGVPYRIKAHLPEGRMTLPWEDDDVVAEDEFPCRLIRVIDIAKGPEVTDGWLGQKVVSEAFECMMSQDVLDEDGNPAGDCPMVVLDMTGVKRFDPRLGRQIMLSAERYGGVAARPDAVVAANAHNCPDQVLEDLGNSGIPIVARIEPKVVERFLWRMDLIASGGTRQTCLKLTREGTWDAPALGVGIEAISSADWTDWEVERDEIALYGTSEKPAMMELGSKVARLVEELHAKAGIIAWARGGYQR